MFLPLNLPICPLCRKSGIDPICGLVDIAVVSLFCVRKTHHNHRGQSAQTFRYKPAQHVAGLLVDDQPIKLVHVRHLFLSADAISQSWRGRNAKRADPDKLHTIIQPKSVGNRTHTAGVVATEQPRLALLRGYGVYGVKIHGLILRHIGVGEVVLEDFTRELLPFTIEDVVPSSPLCCEVKASNP